MTINPKGRSEAQLLTCLPPNSVLLAADRTVVKLCTVLTEDKA